MATAPFLNEFAGSGTSKIGVERMQFSQAGTIQAHALGAVETEELRAGRLEAEPAGDAGVGGREQGISRRCTGARLPLRLFGRRCILFRLHGNDQTAGAHLDRQVHGLCQSRPGARFGHEPVDDDFDVVAHLPVELQIVIEVDHLAIDSRPCIALLQQVVKQVAVFPLLGRGSAGASRLYFVPVSSVMIRSMICSRVCAVTRWPHLGQWACPTRANSTRR